MDLFDDNNPYYRQAVSMPPFEPVFSRLSSYNQSQNRIINWANLQPISCILKRNEQDYITTGRDKFNDSMLAVYNTQDSQREFDLLADVKKFKSTKISDRSHRQLKYPKEFDKVFEELDKEYQLEFHLQRGINPFLHQPNYVQPITVFGQFKNLKNLKSISNIIETCYLPNMIRVCYKLINDDSNYDYKGKFNNVKVIQNLGEAETVQILYMKVNEKQNAGEQLWHFVTMMYKRLDDGGCFVFEMKNLADPAFTQFLYLFQKLFLIISLDHSDILTLSPKISCYGFQRQSSIQILDKVILNLEEIKNNNYNIFRIRQLTQDHKFEHDIVSFYKQYLQKISQQIKLIQQFERGGEISYQEFIQECEKLKEKKKKNHQSFDQGNFNTRQEPRSDNNYKATSTKVINKKIDVDTAVLELDFKKSYRPQWKPSQTKQTQPKQNEKEEQVKKQLEKLLSQGSQKKQTTKEIQQKTYEEQLGLNVKKRTYNTTSEDRKRRH
ncbi:unnamed protein product [Paramecium octaurelia]|uniref:Uncharacterized protein n=1 Tax=Paramecium octaurelia TaxID=43137 RepID=A0A8S1VXG3_PAROT|nr:unnamed protein product [Paramecium octaurelia]